MQGSHRTHSRSLETVTHSKNSNRHQLIALNEHFANFGNICPSGNVKSAIVCRHCLPTCVCHLTDGFFKGLPNLSVGDERIFGWLVPALSFIVAVFVVAKAHNSSKGYDSSNRRDDSGSYGYH